MRLYLSRPNCKPGLWLVPAVVLLVMACATSHGPGGRLARDQPITFSGKVLPVPSRPVSGDWGDALLGTQWEFVNWGVPHQIYFREKRKVHSREGDGETVEMTVGVQGPDGKFVHSSGQVANDWEVMGEFDGWRVEGDLLILFEGRETECHFRLVPGALRTAEVMRPRERVALVRIR